ncbi:MAG: hypothetical protein DMF87_13830 [Acidobacteria bacterium]|nr:MAG: hypothetical protein DMF87_13830 [Acidobacteriota bacterium]
MPWKPVALVATLIAFGFIGAPTTRVWGGCSRDAVTFDHEVTLPGGVVLPAGEYTFQIADMPDLVLVRSVDCEETFYLGFTTEMPRPKSPAGGVHVALGPAPAGEPTPIVAWYPFDSPNGYQFRY